MKLFSKEDLDEVQLSLLEARFYRLRFFRPLFIALLMVPAFWMLSGDGAVWRLWILGLAGAGALFASILEMRYPRRRIHQFVNRRVWLMGPLLAGAFFLATGGFDSPLLPIIVVLTYFIGTLTAARRLVALTATFSAVVLALAYASWRELIPDLLPGVFGGGPGVRQAPALLWSKAGALVLALGWATFVSTIVRDVFRQIVGDALDARDEIIAGHAAHSRELTALSGELAHELKNPLANIKGLAVLVSRDVQGKGVERLEVLQGEVGRMEEILQSFLTFSRPLSPLLQEEVELAELCESVKTLHEGMAHARGVALEVDASSAPRISCDPRKVKQVLINLIQNALEASPAGAAVELAVSRGPEGGARIEVRDRGPGIPPELRAHLFEPGSTTKERGSGLGLALARALARQHGGELSLEDREGVGCVAVLTLPVKPALPVGEAA